MRRLVLKIVIELNFKVLLKVKNLLALSPVKLKHQTDNKLLLLKINCLVDSTKLRFIKDYRDFFRGDKTAGIFLYTLFS